MSQTNQSLADKFKALPAGTRTAIIGGGVVVGLFTLGTIFTDSPKGPAAKKQGAETSTLTVFNPGHDSKSTEAVAADLVVARRQMEEQNQKLRLLEEQTRQAQERGQSGDGQWSEVANLTAQIQALKEEVNGMRERGAAGLPEVAGSNTQPRVQNGNILNAPLPQPGQEALPQEGGAPTGASATPLPAQVGIQVVGGEKKEQAKAADRKVKPIATIPSGSNFEAVLLTGMDASTSVGANKNPTPALLRVKTDAILPNLHSYNVRECFVLVGGFGNMSSERVEMRTETMSCVSENGEVYEGKIEGYVVGEDGKAGARGRLVSKQGSMLAKSFMAGFLGGIGKAFAPQPVQALNIGGGSREQYQYPDADSLVGNGVAGGFSKSANALAQYYISLAQQMHPVLELDASRKMTIILIKGVELTMEKKR